MGLNCGIIGLPNVGKSTIFQALTSAPAQAENYPFCTIEPNVGIVNVPDERIQGIADLIRPQKKISAMVEFVDIAGLVKGASQGEGLGNQFLGHIRQVDALLHIVRCFDDDDIVHVHGTVDPLSDIETINIELCLADLETVNKKYESLAKMFKSHHKDIQKEAAFLKPILERLRSTLEKGEPARSMPMDKEEEEAASNLHLITMKKGLYVCNVDESSLSVKNQWVDRVYAHAKEEGSGCVVICGKIESEIASLDGVEERLQFLKEIGLKEPGLATLAKAAYDLLELKTYFTAGEKEVRAWTFQNGMTARECAGIIHSDFQKGFIKADIYHYNDLLECQSEQKVKEMGRLRQEGRDYLVQDGDIIHFKFNV
ncbi:MAG: redox-regulated ATPase YchF [Bacteriovoracales bacterium]|nr:redox-regulated ATPase YchF [Bacteriovoracales bacterium]